MNSKLEKFYNYIVDNLVKDTEIDYERARVYCPYLSHFHQPYTSFRILHHSYITHNHSFSKYVTERYGVRDEEIVIIWELYKERILTLINE